MSTDYYVDTEKNIYDLLNDMEQDLSGYEKQSVSKEELKKWEKAFYQSRGIKREAWGKTCMKYAMVASLLVCVVVLWAVRGEVSAQFNSMKYTLQELIGNSSYTPTTVVNKTISKHGYNITFVDVAIDWDSVYLTYTVTAPVDVKGMDMELNRVRIPVDKDVDIDVQVNGETVSGGMGGSSEVIGYTDTEVTELRYEEISVENIDLSKDQTIDFLFCKSSLTPFVPRKKIGAVSIVASSEELMAETKQCELNQTLEFEDGSKIALERYTSSPIVQKIYGKIIPSEMGNCNYDVTMTGTDNLGRTMEIYMKRQRENDLVFEIIYFDEEYNHNSVNSTADMTNVTSFMVTAFAKEYPEESGSMDDVKKKPVGEPFTINLQFDEK
ncbi:MAG: hypothetical protein Q4D51_08325 [Eubacteriales bacterium]|nr:hypothetical protein [Eubacteriales bacterium]